MMNVLYEGGGTLTIRYGSEAYKGEEPDLDVYYPPVGKVYQRNPKWENYGELVDSEVWSRSEDPDQQYWDRDKFMSQWKFNYKQRRKREKARQKEDPDYLDEQLEDFRLEMWKYRINGFWFMNNGVPHYITGTHAMYLMWWKIDTGYPGFRLPDLTVFYYWQFAVDSPWCMGIIEAQKRRAGKTKRSGVVAYDEPTRNRETHSGIQSKTGVDAKDNVYTKGVLNSFKHLPDFFIPRYDLDKGRLPKSGLSFIDTNVRGKASLEDSEFEYAELDSSVTWKPSDNGAYDGFKLHRYIGDEVGKTLKPVDVYKRHEVVKFCMMDDQYNIIGKCYYTTTVEEMEAGGEEFKRLWKQSDPRKRNENGRTNSGLIKILIPADNAMKYDIYGYPNKEEAIKVIMNDRASQEDPRALAMLIRKNPLNEREMFYTDGSECMFDPVRINDRLEALDWMENSDLYHMGNLQWVDGPDSEIKFVPVKANARWFIRKDYDPFDKSLWNKVEIRGDQKIPLSNNHSGVDPFSHDKVKEGRGSMGACYSGPKHNAADPKNSLIPFLQYHYRPKTAKLFFEDMLMTWFWTGGDATVEKNKIGLINYAKDRGYGRFLKHYDGDEGITASTSTHPHIAAELEEFVSGESDDILRFTFIDLLTELKTFDIRETEKFDCSMAFGYFRIGCNAWKYRTKKSKTVSLQKKVYDVDEVFH